jgi:hypothetical protein
MKLCCSILVIAVLIGGSGRCFSQSFVNLNFESANVLGVSPPGPVPTQDAFPDWTAYEGPSDDPTYSGGLSAVGYDGISTGGAVISLDDSNANPPYGPIQGNYSLLLEGSSLAADSTASLGQTGTIPSTAQSLVFWANIGGGLTFHLMGRY